MPPLRREAETVLVKVRGARSEAANRRAKAEVARLCGVRGRG
jgi:hypothetical protein